MACRSEDELGKKWDRCITDALIKLVGGVIVGSAFSLVIFKRKKWPIVFGTGFGVGMAYENCQQDINATLKSLAPKPAKPKSAADA